MSTITSSSDTCIWFGLPIFDSSCWNLLKTDIWEPSLGDCCSSLRFPWVPCTKLESSRALVSSASSIWMSLPQSEIIASCSSKSYNCWGLSCFVDWRLYLASELEDESSAANCSSCARYSNSSSSRVSEWASSWWSSCSWSSYSSWSSWWLSEGWSSRSSCWSSSAPQITSLFILIFAFILARKSGSGLKTKSLVCDSDF